MLACTLARRGRGRSQPRSKPRERSDVKFGGQRKLGVLHVAVGRREGGRPVAEVAELSRERALDLRHIGLHGGRGLALHAMPLRPPKLEPGCLEPLHRHRAIQLVSVVVALALQRHVGVGRGAGRDLDTVVELVDRGHRAGRVLSLRHTHGHVRTLNIGAYVKVKKLVDGVVGGLHHSRQWPKLHLVGGKRHLGEKAELVLVEACHAPRVTALHVDAAGHLGVFRSHVDDDVAEALVKLSVDRVDGVVLDRRAHR
mmetsp:Transcript_9535/g.20167  ORF Transcript_9535/g.20167 Transcript_9535/m.20167 type:complete len:255 (+) Transcript_9535:178-942(+)